MPNRSGFTLIELLIVVAIIGFLAAIAVPNFLNARTRAIVSRVQSEMRAVNDACQMYFLDNNAGYSYGQIWSNTATIPPNDKIDPTEHWTLHI